MLHQSPVMMQSRQALVTRQRFAFAGAVVVAALLPFLLRLIVLPDPAYFNTAKISLVAKPRHGGAISSRFFVPYSCHKSHAVTGTVCLASACAIPGTVAEKISGRSQAPQGIIEIEHPSGKIAVDLDADFSNGKQALRRAALIRTARRIFDGNVNVPKAIWAGK